MAKLNAAEFAEKWSRRTSGSTADYTKGINRVTEAPGIKAAQKVDKMRNGINEAIDSGKWAARVAAVSISEWKAAATVKGASRIAAGVKGAETKMQRFAAELIPFQDGLKNTVDQMDDTTLEGRLNKAVAWMRGMSEFRKS